MKVAYIFMSDHTREILENMILPQMEAGVHGADVVGMVFFFDNAYMLHKDSEIGKRLAALSEKNGMMLVGCDYCCQQRGISNDLVFPAGVGCFPTIYPALEGAKPDQVITL